MYFANRMFIKMIKLRYTIQFLAKRQQI